MGDATCETVDSDPMGGSGIGSDDARIRSHGTEVTDPWVSLLCVCFPNSNPTYQ